MLLVLSDLRTEDFDPKQWAGKIRAAGEGLGHCGGDLRRAGGGDLAQGPPQRGEVGRGVAAVVLDPRGRGEGDDPEGVALGEVLAECDGRLRRQVELHLPGPARAGGVLGHGPGAVEQHRKVQRAALEGIGRERQHAVERVAVVCGRGVRTCADHHQPAAVADVAGQGPALGGRERLAGMVEDDHRGEGGQGGGRGRQVGGGEHLDRAGAGERPPHARRRADGRHLPIEGQDERGGRVVLDEGVGRGQPGRVLPRGVGGQGVGEADRHRPAAQQRQLADEQRPFPPGPGDGESPCHRGVGRDAHGDLDVVSAAADGPQRGDPPVGRGRVHGHDEQLGAGGGDGPGGGGPVGVGESPVGADHPRGEARAGPSGDHPQHRSDPCRRGLGRAARA